MWIPINPDDVPALESLLSASDPFVTSMIVTSSPYRLTDYLQNFQSGSEELCALLDRNLVSRAIGLARGQIVDHSRPDSASYRVAAGCMAFLITGKVLVEPNISLHEFAESVDPAEAHQQLVDLRVADHVHPQAYLDVALGREKSIPSWVITEAKHLIEARDLGPIPDFQLPLRHWRRHRCAVAQITLLERSSGSASSKMQRFIDWSATSGFFDATAVCFAAVFFGCKRPGGMLKGVRSPLLDRCLLGIKNAAWDLTYLSHWIRSGEQSGHIWIFCTNDRVLARLARVSVGPEQSARDLFEENWNSEEAGRLHSHYSEVWSRVSSEAGRGEALRERYENIEALTGAILSELSAHYQESDAD